eukprot:jgi/Undpi1/7276/HiC_scaffold_22.g09749.m1
MASTVQSAAAVTGPEKGEEEEDLMASPPSLWLPRTVVKRHRKRATIIWASLLAAFLACESTNKRQYFKFPDVAICASFLEGCLSQTTNCYEDTSLGMYSQSGFLENATDFDADVFQEVKDIREAYPACMVMPLSRLTVNETGVQNGDITSFGASFLTLWSDGSEDFDFSASHIYTQFVSVYFIDIDAGVEAIGEEIVDAKIPYERITIEDGEPFVATQNHMVLSLTEFSGITATGEKKEKERTFSQVCNIGVCCLFFFATFCFVFIFVFVFDFVFDVVSFSFTNSFEVDPVDAWAIFGAIGGVWQFVVIGFGIFFVFSEKQAPDRKMRNFYKTVAKPAVTINKRLSSISSRSSSTDYEIDATDEDLPSEWVKKRRRTGGVYYYNVMTGATRSRSPNDVDDTSASATVGASSLGAPPPPPPRSTAIHGVFRSNGRDSNGEHLPPGWISRADEHGKCYYIDTVRKVTQWERPTMRVHSTGGVGVQAVDTPMVRTRRSSASSSVSASSTSSSAPVRAPAAEIPPTAARRRPDSVHPSLGDTPASSVGRPETTTSFEMQETRTGHVVDKPLPPGWEVRTSADGKKYYANNITKKTQWKSPTA